MATVQDVFIKLTKLDDQKIRVRVNSIAIMDRIDTPDTAPEGAPAKCTEIDFAGASERTVYVKETLTEIEQLEIAAAS